MAFEESIVWTRFVLGRRALLVGYAIITPLVTVLFFNLK